MSIGCSSERTVSVSKVNVLEGGNDLTDDGANDSVQEILCDWQSDLM